jgi:hypothetical protein
MLNATLHDPQGSTIHATDSTLRYVRFVIDVPRGKIEGGVGKKKLLRDTVESMKRHQGRHAGECEIEVLVRVVDEDDVMRFEPGGVDGKSQEGFGSEHNVG